MQDYKKNIRGLFASLKRIDNTDDLIHHSISLKDGMGFLVCLSEVYAEDDIMIELLAKWRREAIEMHNRFEVTFEGTRRWFRELVLDVPDRILFLVLGKNSKRIGHMGLVATFNGEYALEFDLVIRGVSGISPGIMTFAAEALFNWASQEIKPSDIYVGTLESNVHAIQFYARLGFELDSKEFKHGEYHVRMRRNM